MKTPKRYHKIPAERSLRPWPDSWETDHHAQEARWKRKNRIAQLKHTIKRLTVGDHLPNFSKIAYRGMRFMHEPSSDASLSEHLRFAGECHNLALYFSELSDSSLTIARRMRTQEEADRKEHP